MKITKELLEYLKVKSFSLKNDGKDILCHLDRVENGLWTFSVPNAQGLKKRENAEFAVFFEQEEAASVILATVKDSGEDWLTITLKKNGDDLHLMAFLKSLSEMESKYEFFGRRKERRVKIGKENAKKFGLEKLEQEIFLQGAKFLQPCVVLDASVHGICVITPETLFLQKEETFCIKLSFLNPHQTVILKAHKVYSRLSKTEQRTFLTLSCQLLEPIHFSWKNHVISLLEKES